MRAEPIALLLVCVAGMALGEDKALFFRDTLSPDSEEMLSEESQAVRLSRQAQTDQTVRSILEWIQDRYSGGKKTARASNTRSAASEPSRGYLPVDEEEPVDIVPVSRPRPFQPQGSASSSSSNSASSGYPYENPLPPFPAPEQPSYSTEAPLPPLYSSPRPEPPVYSTDRPLYSSPRPEPPVYSTQRPVQPSPETPRPTYLSPRPTYPSSTPPPEPEHGGSETDHDLAHPPHIHEIQVQCSKDMMTINIEFNREFNGVIYSKGFYSQEVCRYVAENSGQTKYSFTVNLNSCGTQFIDQFKEGGQAYLENVLVLQNEAGIQEVWDTIRRVRCLWEGNINKALTVDLSVDMLNQEIVTFSGDTAVATLDIQAGKGPFAPAANGLVKIGEVMTLVVSVNGDPGFDVQVRDCIARDASSDNVVKLTDERGCVLKPKLIGRFQKTRETGNTGASVIAYAFFQAFKFPDIMDLTLDCNVELCKTDCEMCTEPGQNVDPGRRKRDTSPVDNSTIVGEPVRVFRSFRIVTTDDFEEPQEAVIVNLGTDGVCLSMSGFLLSASLMISMLIGSCSMTAYLWLKSTRAATKNVVY